MVRLHLIAEFQNTNSPEDARTQLNAFREAVQPSQEYAISIYEDSTQLATTNEGDNSEPSHPNNRAATMTLTKEPML
jgi:hypothetical protein